MQNLYNIDKNLRLTAGRVIKAAYCTLSNCLKSRSIINTLLFLDSGMINSDNVTIKECLESADGLLQQDKREFLSMEWIEKIRYDEVNQKYLHRNDNCFQRSLLHLLAIFVHKEEVLKHIPKEFIKEGKHRIDIHGCTPLHIAHLHGNQSLISLLESCHAKEATDNFGRTPESYEDPYEYSEVDYTEYCKKIMTTKSSVFDTMNEMLVLPVEECQDIEDNFKELFERMVTQDGVRNARVRIAGSVREKLKVGKFDEVDLQISMDSLPFEGKSFQTIRFHEHLVKRLAEIKWDQISLRPVSVAIPWKFIWERKGCYHGLVISVDIVPICIRNPGLMMPTEMLNLILDKAPPHKCLNILKYKLITGMTVCPKTSCEQEWDILDNLHPGCRLGILIAKALIEALEQGSETNHGLQKHPITSYVIKNTAFWIHAGIPLRLEFKETIPTWTTKEDLESYREDGIIWAEAIFYAINFLARNRRRIFGSFLQGAQPRYWYNDLCVVTDSCERCLERLRKDIFFNEKKNVTDKETV